MESIVNSVEEQAEEQDVTKHYFLGKLIKEVTMKSKVNNKNFKRSASEWKGILF